MSDKETRRKRPSVATTRSTGGAGFAFEDLVAADLFSRFLLDMAIPGIGVPGTHTFSQAGAAGWLIDDLICVGKDTQSLDRHLALSCKSNVQVTGNGWPSDFISNAWNLWRAGDRFDRTNDRMGLVTRGRNAAFDALWADLKLWCDNADPHLAIGRITASAKHRRIFDSVRIPGMLDDVLPSEEETIRLITKIELFPLDLQLANSAALDQAKHRCRMALRSENAEEADALWAALVNAAESARLGNGVGRLTDLLQALAPRFMLKAHPSIASAWSQLLALTTDHRSSIETSLPNGHMVDRTREGGKLVEALEAAKGCVVSGESGAGKSALVRGALDARFPDAIQIWLGPETLSAAMNAPQRAAIGLDHDLNTIFERAPGDTRFLVVDSTERLDAVTLTKLGALLGGLANDPSWHVVLITQLAGFEDQLRGLAAVANWRNVAVSSLSAPSVRAALASVPTLTWIANDPDLVPLIANLRTLGWIIAAESSFHAGEENALTSTAAIADRLWARWTQGTARTQLQRLLTRLAVRDAAFERSFAISDLESGDAAAFDQRSAELPLVVTSRNRIEFRHDLASDWARYQRLKEIAEDIPQWSALARQPLWIAALRLLGQHLLEHPDQAHHGWDHAFAIVSAANNVEAGDVLLDALCLDPSLDRHLGERADLMFANGGALLLRLFHRFLHIATVASIPPNLAIGEGLRIYLEADMRFPILARWGPMGRYLHANAEEIGALGAPIVAKLCKTWLSSLPSMLGSQPMPLRDVMARVALATARTRQVEAAARRRFGDSDSDRLIYGAALAGAGDLAPEISSFALEMAGRRPLGEAVQARVDAMRAADRVEREGRAQVARQRPRASPPPAFLPTREYLPPWPLGAVGRLAGAFRDAVLHGNALPALMEADVATATEVLLACIIEDEPTRDFDYSPRLEDDLGLESDHASYPTIFWHSSFYAFLQARPDDALAALKELVDFAIERWASRAPPDAHIPAIEVLLDDGTTRRFPGTHNQFGWSQHNSTSNGQLFCALDALERWLTQKADAGEDLAPWCERLLAFEGSTAILGILVNLGKHHPALFAGPLQPLTTVEALYWWDAARVRNRSFAFDMWHWSRQGDVIFNLARDWILAPHRGRELRDVVAGVAAANPALAAQILAAASTWPTPDDAKERLEQRILINILDPANRHASQDAATGETVSQFVFPAELHAEITSYQAAANAKLEPLTLPHLCTQILAGAAELTQVDAEYLATIIPMKGEALPDTSERLPMIAAAAATLLARGGDWYRTNSEVAERTEDCIRAVITRVDAMNGDHDDHNAKQALEYAGIGALHAAFAAPDPAAWNAPVATVLTAGHGGAIATLMRVAERDRDRLGPAWYRLNFLLLLFAGLERLSPRFEEKERLTPIWRRWRSRLRAQPIFDATGTIGTVDPASIARRVERLLERRRAREYPNRPSRLNGKARRFAGLSAHVLESGYAWLLDHETAETAAQLPENHQLLAGLWQFEAWRMEGERDGEAVDEEEEEDDDEYDLPSGMGYSILRIAATFVIVAPADDPKPLWRAILAIGPRGYHAVEQFAAGWFLLLFKTPPPERFMAIWRAIIETAFAAGWTGHRRWYRGREMLTRLLGLNAPIELSKMDTIHERVPELIDHYRRWATEVMPHDEDDIATFCHFLTSAAGRGLRAEGMLWLKSALTGRTRLVRSATGNNVAEAIDTVLTHNAAELIAQPDMRNAVIDIVATLVAEQVPTAMGLQVRIAALR